MCVTTKLQPERATSVKLCIDLVLESRGDSDYSKLNVQSRDKILS